MIAPGSSICISPTNTKDTHRMWQHIDDTAELALKNTSALLIQIHTHQNLTDGVGSSDFFFWFLRTNQKIWWGQHPTAFLCSPCTPMEISHWGFFPLPLYQETCCKVISRAAVNIPDNYIWLLMLTICYFVIKTRRHAAQTGVAFMLQ